MSFVFECSACCEVVVRKKGKGSVRCQDCRSARDKFMVFIRGNNNYPRKLCDGCGIHMYNCEYGKARFCAECTVVKQRRHDGWADPYAKATRLLVAANDNRHQTKTCAMCECDLPLADFSNSKTGGLGVEWVCRDCRAALRAHDGRTEEYAKRFRKMPIVHQMVIVKNKKIAILDRKRKADIRRRAKIGRDLDTYLNHFFKPWNKRGLTNADKYRIRYELDVEFRLKQRTRIRMRRNGIGRDALHHMRRVLYGVAGPKAVSSIEAAVGYSMIEFKEHLEEQFTEGMDWEAFKSGAIHIDHIRPLNTFDLDDPAEAIAAWSMHNLRPLWASDNCRRPKNGSDVQWSDGPANDNITQLPMVA